jgi:hypothetical protein
MSSDQKAEKLELPVFVPADEFVNLPAEDEPAWLTPRLKDAGYTATLIVWEAAELDREPEWHAQLIDSALGAIEIEDATSAPVPTPQIKDAVGALDELEDAMVSIDEVRKTPIVRPATLIDGILPLDGSHIVVAGKESTGKSFLTIDQTMTAASGLKWFRRRTTQLRTLYVATEGRKGIQFRVAAWLQEHPDAEPDVRIYPRILQLGNVPARHALVAYAKKQGVRVVVLDTLNPCLSGNENDSETMAEVALLSEELREAAQATLIVVHHPPKDGTSSARGHGSLSNNAETVLQVTCSGEVDDPQATRMLRASKPAKDLPPFGRIYFRLRVVEIGRDEDGFPIVSCVIEPADKPEKAEDAKHPYLAILIDTLIAHPFELGKNDLIADYMGGNNAEARKAFDRGVRDGQIVSQRVNGKKTWGLPEPESDAGGPVDVPF